MKKTITFSNIPLRIAVSETKFKSNHYHPDVLEMLFVLEGRLAVTTGQRTILVQEGEFLAVNAGQLHCLNCDQISTSVSMYFDLGNYTEMLPFIRGVRFTTEKSRLKPEQLPYWEELRNYFIRLMLMHNKNTRSAQTIMHELGNKIVQLLWLHFQDRKKLPEQVLERYYSISTYLHDNYKGDISVTQVARHENISVTRLAHFWKDASDHSIRQTITKLRLVEAEKMLLETPMTINDIAYHCGFSDEKYFYQHFKSHFKVTPNEYRIKNLEDQRQTARVLLSRREGEQRFAAYAMKYYTSGVAPSLPDLTEADLEKEGVLGKLYEAILCNTNTLIKQMQATKQEIGYLQVTPGRALYMRNGEYCINWEYVYAQMHIFLDYNITFSLLINFDCMVLVEWEKLLRELVDELLTIWGKNVVESQHYSIYSNVIPDYVQCMELAGFLKEKTPVKHAQAIFML